MWLFDLFFPQFSKSDISRYWYLEVFQTVPDEIACNRLSHHDLHYLPICFWFLTQTPFPTMDMSVIKDGIFYLRNSKKDTKRSLQEKYLVEMFHISPWKHYVVGTH